MNEVSPALWLVSMIIGNRTGDEVHAGTWIFEVNVIFPFDDHWKAAAGVLSCWELVGLKSSYQTLVKKNCRCQQSTSVCVVSAALHTSERPLQCVDQTVPPAQVQQPDPAPLPPTPPPHRSSSLQLTLTLSQTPFSLCDTHLFLLSDPFYPPLKDIQRNICPPSAVLSEELDQIQALTQTLTVILSSSRARQNLWVYLLHGRWRLRWPVQT